MSLAPFELRTGLGNFSKSYPNIKIAIRNWNTMMQDDKDLWESQAQHQNGLHQERSQKYLKICLNTSMASKMLPPMGCKTDVRSYLIPYHFKCICVDTDGNLSDTDCIRAPAQITSQKELVRTDSNRPSTLVGSEFDVPIRVSSNKFVKNLYAMAPVIHIHGNGPRRALMYTITTQMENSYFGMTMDYQLHLLTPFNSGKILVEGHSENETADVKWLRVYPTSPKLNVNLRNSLPKPKGTRSGLRSESKDEIIEDTAMNNSSSSNNSSRSPLKGKDETLLNSPSFSNNSTSSLKENKDEAPMNNNSSSASTNGKKRTWEQTAIDSIQTSINGRHEEETIIQPLMKRHKTDHVYSSEPKPTIEQQMSTSTLNPDLINRGIINPMTNPVYVDKSHAESPLWQTTISGMSFKILFPPGYQYSDRPHRIEYSDGTSVSSADVLGINGCLTLYKLPNSVASLGKYYKLCPNQNISCGNCSAKLVVGGGIYRAVDDYSFTIAGRFWGNFCLVL